MAGGDQRLGGTRGWEVQRLGGTRGWERLNPLLSWVYEDLTQVLSLLCLLWPSCDRMYRSVKALRDRSAEKGPDIGKTHFALFLSHYHPVLYV